MKKNMKLYTLGQMIDAITESQIAIPIRTKEQALEAQEEIPEETLKEYRFTNSPIYINPKTKLISSYNSGQEIVITKSDSDKGNNLRFIIVEREVYEMLHEK